MKIFIAADHKGVELKNEVITYLVNNGIEVEENKITNKRIE